MIRLKGWIDDQARRRTLLYVLAMDNRVYGAVIVLSFVTGILTGIYG